MTDRLFLTLDGVAEELLVSPDHVRHLIETGVIRAQRFGKRTTRVPMAELERLAGFRPTPETAADA